MVVAGSPATWRAPLRRFQHPICAWAAVSGTPLYRCPELFIWLPFREPTKNAHFESGPEDSGPELFTRSRLFKDKGGPEVMAC